MIQCNIDFVKLECVEPKICYQNKSSLCKSKFVYEYLTCTISTFSKCGEREVGEERTNRKYKYRCLFTIG